MNKQKLMSVAAIFVMLGTTLSATAPAYAATSSSTNGGFLSGLFQFIAQKFGLDQNQVKSAVQDYANQNKTKIQQNMATREKKRLDALVTRGKITSAQETAIINELATLQSKYNIANFKSLTPDARKQKFQDEQNEIKTWAASQNIDPKYVLPGFGMGMQGHMRRFDRWGGAFASPTPTP